jgi:hypothetical protein
MVLEPNVYVTVAGLLVWAIATIAWSVRKNRSEGLRRGKGMGFFDRGPEGE